MSTLALPLYGEIRCKGIILQQAEVIHKKFCIDKYGLVRTLKFLKRTRNFRALFTGRSINMPTKPGDLLIWNMRIHHSGFAVRVKGLKNHSFHPWIEDRIPSFLHYPAPEKRSVIFASYGAPSGQLENYIRNRVQRPDKKAYWIECSKCRFDAPVIRELARVKGVTLRSDGIDHAEESANTGDL